MIYTNAVVGDRYITSYRFPNPIWDTLYTALVQRGKRGGARCTVKCEEPTGSSNGAIGERIRPYIRTCISGAVICIPSILDRIGDAAESEKRDFSTIFFRYSKEMYSKPKHGRGYPDPASVWYVKRSEQLAHELWLARKGESQRQCVEARRAVPRTGISAFARLHS